jgi:hypothetical protein
MSLFGRGFRHPFYPALSLAPAARAKKRCPALAGTFRELREAAMAGAAASRAVFPLHRPTRPFLEEAEREALWSMFGVPVIAILLDGRGEAVGWECEAQHGLHLAPDYSAGLLFGSIESTTCDCGRPGPRLVRVPSEYERCVPIAALRRSAGAGVR